jgi:hypothetical protein
LADNWDLDEFLKDSFAADDGIITPVVDYHPQWFIMNPSD